MIIRHSIWSAFILLWASAVQAAGFADLKVEDVPPEHRERIARLLPAARSGHTSSQMLIARSMYFAERPVLAAALMRELYDKLGFDFDPKDQPLYLDSYAILGKLLLDGEGVAPDPVLAMKLLTESARRGSERAQASLQFYLEYSSFLPPLGGAAEAWQTHGSRTDSPPEPISYSRPPADLAFGDCENFLGRTDAILDRLETVQQRILEQPEQADTLRQAAHEAWLAEPGPISDSSDGMVTFRFFGIPLTVVMSLLFDMAGDDRQIAAPEPDYQLAVHAVDVPAALLAAQILDAFNLRARCAPGWVRLESRKPIAPDASKPFVLGGMIRSADPAGTRDGRLQWFGGMEWRGAHRNGLPQGFGVLMLSADNRLEATFVDGRPHGAGVWNLSPLHRYEGEFQHGFMQGPGEIDFFGKAPGPEYAYDPGGYAGKGHFERDRFHGQGHLRMPSGDRSQMIYYHGPFVDNEAHGEGRCTVGTLSYPCSFDNGEMIGIADTALYPSR